MPATTLWDLPTRLIHWTLAVCVVLNLFVLESGEPPHTWVGYLAVGAVLARIVWGICGGKHSRFAHFPWGYARLKAFLLQYRQLRADEYPGHNPLAAWIYVAIWLLILALGVSGWMLSLDAFWGEEWLETLHARFSDVVKILVVLHLVGMIADSFKFRRRTWLGMILGRRY